MTEACRVVAISPRTLQRWRDEGEVKADGRQQAGQQRVPANKLSEDERRQILVIANEPEFAQMPPSQIVPILADRGRYIASESSFYRVRVTTINDGQAFTIVDGLKRKAKSLAMGR
jgi:hypothetical protein